VVSTTLLRAIDSLVILVDPSQKLRGTVKWGNVVTFLHKTIFFSESYFGDVMLCVA
jgi:hypothetical protein